MERPVPAAPPALAPRRRCAVSTREAMLCAARARFVAESYDNVGLRDIARDAGVDVALVGRYFGSKEELFRAVLQTGHDASFDVEVPRAELPAYLVSLLLDRDEPAQNAHAERMIIILRSASSPAAAGIVRDAARGDVLEPLARLIGTDEADVRPRLILAMLIGITTLRRIMAVEPLSAGSCTASRVRLLRLFEAALAD